MTTSAAVRERPIPFSGPMVRAILAGRKTQTRRVVKPQPDVSDWRTSSIDGRWTGADAAWRYRGDGWWIEIPGISEGAWRCPFGQPGDLLYVRETWTVHRAFDNDAPRELAGTEKVRYAADGSRWELARARPPMFMPKWAARIWLRVTDVRVEQLRDLTEADAQAEGVEPYPSPAAQEWIEPGRGGRAYGDAFAALWDSLNTDRGYEFARNPWVWVVSFERAEAPRG